MNIETISILCTGIVVGVILTAVFYLVIGLQEEVKKDKQDNDCNEDCEAVKSYQRVNEELSSENEYLLANWKNAETRCSLMQAELSKAKKNK